MDGTEENGSLMRARSLACDDANDMRRLELRQHRHLPCAEKITRVRNKTVTYIFLLQKLVDGDSKSNSDATSSYNNK